jgi:hypothetical protein
MSTIGSDTPSSSRELAIDDEREAALNSRTQRKVLEEDEYLGRMAQIIRRDFFSDPDHSFQATDSTPSVVASERTDKSANDTPGTYRSGISTTSSMRSRQEACSMRLNEFLSKYTSEDNAYFDKLQAKDLKRHRLRFPWLYKGYKRDKNPMGLKEGPDGKQLDGRPEDIKMIGWDHNPRNTLFYPPSDNSTRDLPSSSTVNYESNKYSREPLFKVPPAPNGGSRERPKTSLNRFTDKIGIDGKLLNGSETPSMNGYSYVPPPETPQPVTDTSHIKQESQRFYLPNESPRDVLAHRLYEDKIARKIRTPKSGTRSDLTKTPKNKLNDIF